ncbi:MAG: AzlC family ABC transporter permease [Selenomonadaceae bacterium]|nr:AzlC family ABC transporter permease [Selenomonadaceae bacterium]
MNEHGKESPARAALKAAFPYTVPIFAGFWFLGLAYGVYMNVSGFSVIYPMLMSLLIFAGSVEFLVVPMLLGTFQPLQAFVMGFVVNARHIFYGISMLEKYRGWGWKTPYLIYGMCDESFSINYTAKIPKGINKGWFYFWVTLLNHFYWFSGAAIGGLLGSWLSFDTKGLDFVLTAMFVTIFTEQWLLEESHRSSLVGVGVSLLSLWIFGADQYIIPAMTAILAAFLLGRRYFA